MAFSAPVPLVFPALVHVVPCRGTMVFFVLTNSVPLNGHVVVSTLDPEVFPALSVPGVPCPRSSLYPSVLGYIGVAGPLVLQYISPGVDCLQM